MPNLKLQGRYHCLVGMKASGILMTRAGLECANWRGVARALYPLFAFRSRRYFPHQCHPKGIAGITTDPEHLIFEVPERLSLFVSGPVCAYAIIETTGYHYFSVWESGRETSLLLRDVESGTLEKLGDHSWEDVEDGMDACLAFSISDLWDVAETSWKQPVSSRRQAESGEMRETLLRIADIHAT